MQIKLRRDKLLKWSVATGVPFVTNAGNKKNPGLFSGTLY